MRLVGLKIAQIRFENEVSAVEDCLDRFQNEVSAIEDCLDQISK